MKRFVAAFAFPALAVAHIALWDPAMYGFNVVPAEGQTDRSMQWPLDSLPFNRWWFHGPEARNDKPKAPKQIQSGGTLTLELACNKDFTSYGTKTSNDPCPSDVNSLHSGHGAYDPSELAGCGIAIAYKSELADVKPEDFTVFSVNHRCVEKTRTQFEIPAGMPSCPNGKCICAWFWQGLNSKNEMYMTGFDCAISNGTPDARLATPQIPRYCGSDPSRCVKGAKQPMYWQNDLKQVDWSGEYREKPSYNNAWGFKNGAQTDIFGQSGPQPKPKPGPAPEPEPEPEPEPQPEPKPEPKPEPAPAPEPAPSPSKSSSAAPRPTTTTKPPAAIAPPPAATPPPSPKCKPPVIVTKTVTTTKTQGTRPFAKPTRLPSTPECDWKGHCLGDSCKKDQDCDDEMVCEQKKCVPGPRTW